MKSLSGKFLFGRIKLVTVAAISVLQIVGCASKPSAPTYRQLEQRDIKRLIAKANPEDLQSCRHLAGGMEGQPVGEYVGSGVGKAFAFIALLPVALVVCSVDKQCFSSMDNVPGFKDAWRNSSINAAAREKVTARCVDLIATEREHGADSLDMAGPLVRLGDAYRDVSPRKDGPEMEQAARLYERALAVAEKHQPNNRELIQTAGESYLSALHQLERTAEWQSVCARIDAVRSYWVCTLARR